MLNEGHRENPGGRQDRSAGWLTGIVKDLVPKAVLEFQVDALDSGRFSGAFRESTPVAEETKTQTHPEKDGEKGDSMKKFCSLTTLIAVFCLLFAYGSRQARADSFTMTLTGVGGASAGPYYIYPYDFTIKTGSKTYTNVALMCISFDREIYFGETWTANEFPAASLGTQYEEAAYLYSLAAAGPSGDAVADAQWAAWYLFDPGAGDVDPADGHNISGLITTAALDASGYANYDVYLPVPGSQIPSTDGLPQIFIGNGEPPYEPTPEPSSLILLATGLLGLASLLYYKKRGVPATSRIRNVSL